MDSEGASLLAVTTGISHKGCSEAGPSFMLGSSWIKLKLGSGSKSFSCVGSLGFKEHFALGNIE